MDMKRCSRCKINKPLSDFPSPIESDGGSIKKHTGFDEGRKNMSKKTLLRRKLDFISNETADIVDKLFKRNHTIGLRPNSWKDIDAVDEFNAMLKLCPELDDIYAAGFAKELAELYQSAELMEADEFEHIKKTDSELAELLLNGPQKAFCFELDEASLKRAEELRIILEN